MASRDGLCPCLSQTNDSVVWCQLADGHEGLHHWQDPVHPGHSKSWGGSITELVTDTRWRYESQAALRQRLGLNTAHDGRVQYTRMQSAQQEDADAAAVELLSSRGGLNVE